jgi:hypothetical protein
MPWMKWLPWRFLVRRVARAHGFLDPIALLARLHRFAQPSEVGEPIELLRAGVVFHARGLINSRVIQHNLDWVWPYWVERQFNPKDDAFVPRAFSITHVNLTHRNWTAVGQPDCPELPIVDPRGMLTPLYDGWSLDAWIVTDDGRELLPSRARSATQTLDMTDQLAVVTQTHQDGLAMQTASAVQLEQGLPVCHLALQAHTVTPGWLVLALRPYNPEGISFIHEVMLSPERTGWTVDQRATVEFDRAADRHHVSDYRSGDVRIHLQELDEQRLRQCDVGMATAAAMFRLDTGKPRDVLVRVPLGDRRKVTPVANPSWQDSLRDRCELRIPEQHLQFLYDAALRTLVLHSPGDVFSGPYTYKRFWFRDAAFIIYGLLCAGLIERAERALDRFPSRQTTLGYFHSQEGEWDANGEVLWIMHQFCRLVGQAPKPGWYSAIVRGARWIIRKRLAEDSNVVHAGLLPAGFSAEHLGPNDYYYWDDFWGIAGLRSAAALCERIGDGALRDEFLREARAFQQAVDRSLAKVQGRLNRPAMPASPHRRLDAGAIGSLVVGYPLQGCGPHDPRLLATVEFLLANCFVDGGFFQDMIHSGINAYLTLHVAQVLLRAGDARCFELIQAVAALASATGQWPEAIHPRTHGGCMGDGQHVWAAAEWVLMMRNCFVREEGDRLVLGSGVMQAWLDHGTAMSFGPAPTAFGHVSVHIAVQAQGATRRLRVSWRGDWHAAAPAIELRVPGFAPATAPTGQSCVELSADAV